MFSISEERGMSTSFPIAGSADLPGRATVRERVRAAPGPAGLPLVGSALAIGQQGILPFLVAAHRRYGDLVGFRIGPQSAHLVVGPALIEQVLGARRESYVKGRDWDTMRLLTGNGLLTSDGSHWQRQRRLLQPFFTAKAVATHAHEMTCVAAETAERWTAAAVAGRSLELHEEMLGLALDVLGRTLFGVRFSDQAQSVGHAVSEAIRFVAQRSRQLLPPPLWLPTPGNRRFLAAKAALVRFIRERIFCLADGAHDTPAMLAVLQQAHDPVTGQRMSDAELIDELITLVIAGHETSAVALTWTLCLLGRNPEAEAQLHRELDAVLAGRLPTLADVPALTYTRRVLDEALRLYPTAWVFPRTCLRDERLGDCDIPQGSMILVCPYLTHRLPEYFPQPERFLPERFDSEDAPARPRHAYLPFGAGPHTCIGQHFAMQELVLSLATLTQRIQLRLHDSRLPPMDAESTLRPGAPVYATPLLRR